MDLDTEIAEIINLVRTNVQISPGEQNQFINVIKKWAIFVKARFKWIELEDLVGILNFIKTKLHSPERSSIIIDEIAFQMQDFVNRYENTTSYEDMTPTLQGPTNISYQWNETDALEIPQLKLPPLPKISFPQEILPLMIPSPSKREPTQPIMQKPPRMGSVEQMQHQQRMSITPNMQQTLRMSSVGQMQHRQRMPIPPNMQEPPRMSSIDQNQYRQRMLTPPNMQQPRRPLIMSQQKSRDVVETNSVSINVQDDQGNNPTPQINNNNDNTDEDAKIIINNNDNLVVTKLED